MDSIGRPSAARPTLEAVADRAGVSRATASRVLRGASNVSDDARERVLAAAAQLSYSVNRAARSLVTRRSDSVAFLVAENEDRLFNDPYFLGILRGAQAEVGAAGMQLVFVIASSPSDFDQFERYAAGGHVDGVLLISLHGDDELPLRLESMGVPTVLNGRPWEPDSPIYSVDSDNLAGGRLAAQALIAAGRRRIATITGPLDMAVSQDRLAGFRTALAAGGYDLDERFVVEGDFTVEGGARAMAELLARGEPGRGSQAPDALFAASDLTALGAMQMLGERGLQVPADIAVVGFDDVRAALFTTPALTTVRQPIDQLGRTMARVLLDRINDAGAPLCTVLPVELVCRGSL